MMPLSTYIRAEFPQVTPDATTEWDKAGAVVLSEAAIIVASFGLAYPTIPAPSASRILAAVAGGPFADARYASRSMLVGMSAAFDVAQAAVVAGYATLPIPIWPPTSVPPYPVLSPIIYAAYRTDLAATNPDFAAYPETAQVQRIMDALAKFVNGAYV